MNYVQYFEIRASKILLAESYNDARDQFMAFVGASDFVEMFDLIDNQDDIIFIQSLLTRLTDFMTSMESSAVSNE